MQKVRFSNEKGQKFALLFDGFIEGAENALRIFIVTGSGQHPIGFSSFEDEGSMTGSEHIEFLEWILDHYKLQAANWVCIVADK
ncbi:hypothetical protein PINS_up018556 [Pythium insidiosum]|nr:hypothetical protein PINS_up004126 [Pythium insidiosum]GLE07850.1 hypothetical protein PINS_up018556 [Pythium insidiosum]